MWTLNKFFKALTISRKPEKPTIETIQKPVATTQLYYDVQVAEGDEALKRRGVGREYLKKLMYDPEIAQCCDTRRDYVASTPLLLNTDNEELKEFIENEILKHSSEIIGAIWTAVLYGYSVCGIEWTKRNDGSIGLGRFVLMPLEYYSVRASGQWQGTVDGILTDLDPLKYLVTVRNPTYENPKGESLLSRLLWTAQFKTNGQNFWIKFLERFATPTTWGKTDAQTVQLPDGTETDTVSLLSDALAESFNNKTIATDSTTEIGTLEPNHGGEPFKLFDDQMKNEIQKLILGSGAVSQTENNNRASGKTGENTLEQKINNDLRLCLASLQELIDKLIYVNSQWGKSFNYSICEIELQTAEDIKENIAARDKILTETGLKFSTEYYKKQYGFDDTDIATTPTPNEPSFSFALSENKFTPEIQAIENLATMGQPQPIDPQIIIAKLEEIERNGGGFEESKLAFAEMAKLDNAELIELYANALYSSHVLGYVHLEERIKSNG